MSKDQVSQRMAELMAPIEQQILMCDDQKELLMLACAMMQRTHEIFLKELGENGTKLMYEEFI